MVWSSLCISPLTGEIFERSLIHSAFHRKDSKCWRKMSLDALKMHIRHPLINFVECIVMKRSSDSVSVWHVAALFHTQSNSLSPISRRDFHSLELFSTLFISHSFHFSPPKFPFLLFFVSLCSWGLSSVYIFFKAYCVFLWEEQKERKREWVGRFITLIATLTFRELWLRNALSSAIKRLNNPYPHVHKNQISETSFHSWRLLQTKQRESEWQFISSVVLKLVERWAPSGWMSGFGRDGWMMFVGLKHYCTSAYDLEGSEFSSVHLWGGEYGLEQSGGWCWLLSRETYQEKSSWPGRDELYMTVINAFLTQWCHHFLMASESFCDL